MAHIRTNEEGYPLIVPASITRDELNEALDPLYTLLNITKNHVYDVPGLIIGFDMVTFVAPAVSPDEWVKERPPANVDPETAVQGRDHGSLGELMQTVVVRVITDPSTESDEASA